jgi:hypothetical protein
MTKHKSRVSSAFILIASLVLLTSWLFPPPAPSVQPSAQTSVAQLLKSRPPHSNPFDLLFQEKLKRRWREAELRALGLRASSLPTSTDMGDLAVIQDDGTIIIQPNPFDLSKKLISFTPAASGGFSVGVIATSIDRAFGAKLTSFTGSDFASDDGYQQVTFTGGFSFTYYGATYRDVFVGTNGFLTFGAGDADVPPHESIADFLKLSPRVAAFWHDLDPGRARSSGGVFVNQLADRFVVTWNAVPEFTTGTPRDFNTFQITLYADGRIAFTYDDLATKSALVGLSPGNTAQANRLDLSNPPSAGVNGAVLEFFSATRQVDFFAASQAFYATHPDRFDFLYLWTDFDFDISPGQSAFAAYFALRNDIQGIGQPMFDESSLAGSRGRLQGMLIMGNIDSAYPASPTQLVPDLTLPYLGGTFTALGVMGQETGHRWGSFVRFKDGDTMSPRLLGRDGSHWSFFLHTESTTSTTTAPRASAMEGNVWQQRSAQRFATPGGELSEGYSPLDLYLMGLRSPEEVPDFFLIENPAPVSNKAWLLRLAGAFNASGPPFGDIGISGRKRTLSVRDVIAAEGTRMPTTNTSQKEFRVAFILLVQPGTQPLNTTLTKLNRYRTSWEEYFLKSTDGRATIRTALRE